MRNSRRLAAGAALAVIATALAACSASSGSSAIGNGSTSAAAGQKVPGGTVTIAWPDGTAPNELAEYLDAA